MNLIKNSTSTLILLIFLIFPHSAYSKSQSKPAASKLNSYVQTIKTKSTELFNKLKTALKEANIIEKTSSFVEGKSKTNSKAIEAAADGEMKVVGKRYIAKDPTAKKLQEKLDRAQSERLQKYDKFDSP